ncbi:MAG: hypothetical protein II870_01095 [Synergistaceae bacterium]|nr:hypothetical protein [Synergistaceae bacterium]
MGKFFDKIRQVFNLFLIMFLVGAVTAVFIYFLTTPEQRGTTFWISMGFLTAALVLCTLFASRIAMRGNSGRAVPGHFAQLFLIFAYFAFVVIISIVNAFKNFGVTTYLLIHVGGLFVFMLPLILMNMAMLKQNNSERKQQEQGRVDLSIKANHVNNLLNDIITIAPELATGDKLSKIKNLAESLRYSDPTPAPRSLENALNNALNNLEDLAAGLSSSEDVNNKLPEILRAVTQAERALTDRNTAVLNAK